MAQQQTQSVTGEVEAANDKGVKVAGRWFNYSQFREVPRPDVGQTVVLEIVRDRFINGLRVLTPGALDELEGEASSDFDGMPALPLDDDPGAWGYDGSGKGTAAPRPVRQPAPAPPARPQPVQAPATRAGSREGVRATCALAAATWAQGRADVDAQDLVGIAQMLYAWAVDKED